MRRLWRRCGASLTLFAVSKVQMGLVLSDLRIHAQFLLGGKRTASALPRYPPFPLHFSHALPFHLLFLVSLLSSSGAATVISFACCCRTPTTMSTKRHWKGFQRFGLCKSSFSEICPSKIQPHFRLGAQGSTEGPSLDCVQVWVGWKKRME